MSRFGCGPDALATMEESTLRSWAQAERSSCDVEIPQSVRDVLRIADAAQQRGNRDIAIKSLALAFDLLDLSVAAHADTPA